MTCFTPLKGFKSSAGGFTPNRRNSPTGVAMTVPCGGCVGCRAAYAQAWAVRCVHESKLYSANCFITLTYADEFLPSDMSLRKSDFQKFMKRLRKHYAGADMVLDYKTAEATWPIRFFHCGEYGEQLARPHYHALLFNFDFPDKTFWRTGDAGDRIFRSKILEDLWGKGFCEIGSVTFESAAYVARYISKKITGAAADDYYRTYDRETGEVCWRQPEYCTQSRNPGLGAAYVAKFNEQFFPDDFIVIDGRKVLIPRYYFELYKRDFDEVLHSRPLSERTVTSDVKMRRKIRARKGVDNNTPERLAVRKTVFESRLSLLKRNLE